MGSGYSTDDLLAYNYGGESNDLNRPQPAPQLAPYVDVTKDLGFNDKYGKFETSPSGMIIHHTGGGTQIGQVINTFKERNVATQFVIGRDGTIYQTLPDGMRGQHIQPGYGPMGEGKNNRNMEGVELMAKDDNDITREQQIAAAQLYAQRAAKYGWNVSDPSKAPIWGHGEVNPNTREATEGATVVRGIRSGTLALPAVPGGPSLVQNLAYSPNALMPGQNVPVSAAAPGEVGIKLHRPIPKEIEPTLNYWADYYNLDRNIFANMINHESSYNATLPGSSGEIGLGQLMPDTARGLGLNVNVDQGGNVDERTDINKNLMGSAKYLRQMLDHPRSGGDYGTALMMYNRGPGGKLNPAYASAVMGPGGKYAMPAGGGGGGFEADLPASTPPNPLALSPPSTVAVDIAREAAAQQDQMRRAMLYSQVAAAVQNARSGKAPSSGYDPAKVIEGRDQTPLYRVDTGPIPQVESTIRSRPLMQVRSVGEPTLFTVRPLQARGLPSARGVSSKIEPQGI